MLQCKFRWQNMSDHLNRNICHTWAFPSLQDQLFWCPCVQFVYTHTPYTPHTHTHTNTHTAQYERTKVCFQRRHVSISYKITDLLLFLLSNNSSVKVICIKYLDMPQANLGYAVLCSSVAWHPNCFGCILVSHAGFIMLRHQFTIYC